MRHPSKLILEEQVLPPQQIEKERVILFMTKPFCDYSFSPPFGLLAIGVLIL
jgi:hypothetical protein